MNSFKNSIENNATEYDLIAIKYVSLLSLLSLLFVYASLYFTLSMHSATGFEGLSFTSLLPRAALVIFALITPFWIYRKLQKFDNKRANDMGFNLKKIVTYNKIIALLIYANFVSLSLTMFVFFK